MAVAAIHRNRVHGLKAETSNAAKCRSAQKRAREARDDPLGVLRAVAAAKRSGTSEPLAATSETKRSIVLDHSPQAPNASPTTGGVGPKPQQDRVRDALSVEGHVRRQSLFLVLPRKFRGADVWGTLEAGRAVVLGGSADTLGVLENVVLQLILHFGTLCSSIIWKSSSQTPRAGFQSLYKSNFQDA
jgi:hypothetical protein